MATHQHLTFYAAQILDPLARKEVRGLVSQLGDERAWSVGRPELFDSADEHVSSGEPASIDVVGGELTIHSPANGNLAREVDLQDLSDVEYVVEAVSKFSRKHHISFEFELDGKFVGSIDDGILDRSLSEGLLGAWRKQLAGHSAT